MVDVLLVSRTGNILLVGRKRPNQSVEIVNAFQGEEAEELYRRLLEKKGDANVSGQKQD